MKLRTHIIKMELGDDSVFEDAINGACWVHEQKGDEIIDIRIQIIPRELGVDKYAFIIYNTFEVAKGWKEIDE